MNYRGTIVFLSNTKRLLGARDNQHLYTSTLHRHSATLSVRNWVDYRIHAAAVDSPI